MSLGIPYMGGKRKLAKPILDYILTKNPNCKYFYDLFGGGGAISFESLKRKQLNEVHYNEYDTAIVELIKHIRDNGITDKMYEWVNREAFHELKNGKDWYSGFLKTCWSFGNNGIGYLFGEDIEKLKHLAHQMLVYFDDESRIELQGILGIEIPIEIHNIKGLHKRRKWFQRLCKGEIGRTQQLERITYFEQLSRLQQLQQLQQLQLHNESYENVKINTPIEETIIYCDPPYKGTSKYQNDIDHDKFYNWVKNNPYKIYVSSYEFDLPCVYEMEHISTLSSTNNSKRVVEKLFCNKSENNYGQQILF